MGFFMIDWHDVDRYIGRFTEWLRTEHDTKPRRKLKADGEVVACFKKVPISKSTYPGGEARVVLSEKRDWVQGYYRRSRWDEEIEYPPVKARFCVGPGGKQ